MSVACEKSAPPPGKSVMRTNFVTPKSSGHQSALTAQRFGEQYGQRQRVWICKSSRSTKNKAAVERRKRRKKKQPCSVFHLALL